MDLQNRTKFTKSIQELFGVSEPSDSLLNYDVDIHGLGKWKSWVHSVPNVEIEPNQIGLPDLIVPTVDTIRHIQLIRMLISILLLPSSTSIHINC